MKKKINTHSLLAGLNTTAREDGLELPEWVTFQNVRVHDGSASIRAGMQLVEKVDDVKSCISFDGANYMTIPLDSRVHTLKTRWTMEMLINPSGVVGTQPIIQGDHASNRGFRVYLDDDSLKVDIQSSAYGTKTAEVTTVSPEEMAVQITRDDDDLYVSVNGGGNTASWSDSNWSGVDCITPGGDILVGTDDTGTDFFIGKIDFIRLLDVVWRRDGTTLYGAGDRYSWIRFPDPKARYVLFDYSMDISETTNNRVDDRSRYGNHGVMNASPATVTSFARNDMPIQMIRERLDEDAKHRLDVIAGGTIYLGEVGG